MDLERIYNNVKTLDVVDLAVDIFESLDEFIADLNRSQLADKGIRPDGSNITPEYSTVTELLKRPKSGTAGITSHVTLYDSGSFHKSIVASIYPDEIVMDATDSKTNDLLDKYGEVLGLTEENKQKLKDKFLPIFEKRFYESIFG